MTERSAAVKSAWAEGVTYFAVALLIVAGIFQALQGLSALFSDDIYDLAARQLYAINLTTWGWIHLFIGVFMVAVGVGLFYGTGWARGAGVGIAVVQAVTQFAFLPLYPAQSIVIIALDVAIFWAILTYRSDKFM